MQKVLTAEEMREVDRQTVEKYGIPFLLLMENAAHAAANIIRKKLGGSVKNKSFLILCGKGNNGGDGAALARILWTQGAIVNVYLFGKVDEIKGEARINFEIIQKSFRLEEVELSENSGQFLRRTHFLRKDVIVDAMFGTGLTRPMEGLAAQISETTSLIFANKTPLLVSLDIPSGLNVDSAQGLVEYKPHKLNSIMAATGSEISFVERVGSIFQADLTVTFTVPKIANVLPPAARFNGEVVCVNIGSPQELIDAQPSQLFLAEKSDAQNWLRETAFTVDSYKKTRGHALVVAGSRNMSGAAVLCANAAMTSGVGLVTVATPVAAQTAVASRVLPEIMVAAQMETSGGAIADGALDAVLKLSEKTNAAVLGCGLSSNEDATRNFVRKFVENRKTAIVIDADGLNALAPFDLQGSDELPLVLTPHIGEMRRLIGADETTDLSNSVKLVGDFAKKHHVVLVLKGERSLIAAPDGRVVVNPTGNAGLGKAGNGDALAGIIAGFVAQIFAAPKNLSFYTAETAPWQLNAAFDATVAALYIAGLAGDMAARKIGMRAMTASDVRECLPDAFAALAQD